MVSPEFFTEIGMVSPEFFMVSPEFFHRLANVSSTNQERSSILRPQNTSEGYFVRLCGLACA